MLSKYVEANAFNTSGDYNEFPKSIRGGAAGDLLHYELG